MTYGIILADPAWSYTDKCNAGKRGACHKYKTMTIDEVKSLRPIIDDLAAPDCALFLWVPSPLAVRSVLADVMQAWDFAPKTKAFSWVKVYDEFDPTKPVRPFMGMGHWSRTNTEDCWLGVRGSPKRLSADVRQVIFARPREHSRKPDEIYQRIERLMGDVPRIELFARQHWPGWDSWGSETHKFTPRPAA